MERSMYYHNTTTPAMTTEKQCDELQVRMQHCTGASATSLKVCVNVCGGDNYYSVFVAYYVQHVVLVAPAMMQSKGNCTFLCTKMPEHTQKERGTGTMNNERAHLHARTCLHALPALFSCLWIHCLCPLLLP